MKHHLVGLVWTLGEFTRPDGVADRCAKGSFPIRGFLDEIRRAWADAERGVDASFFSD
jgi:hypothetical protein